MSGKMKALVKDKPEPGVSLQFKDIPELGPHEVLVKVKAASICGTDLHIYNWDKWAAERLQPPVIIGHEMSGYIARLGMAVRGWSEGDYVSLECHKICGLCYQCQTGKAHLCQNYTILGVDFDGCFAEYVKVSETNLWKNHPELPPQVACLQDPVGNAVLATVPVDLIGKRVLVTGCGNIGLFAIGIACALGADGVYGVDINEYRLDIARKMGASLAINPVEENMVEKVMGETGGEGVDVVVEMSGSEKRLREGFKLIKHGGQVSLLGIPQEEVSLDLAGEIIFKGVNLSGITGREIFATWYRASSLLRNTLDVSPIITHQFPLEAYREAFQVMQSGKCGKVILYP